MFMRRKKSCMGRKALAMGLGAVVVGGGVALYKMLDGKECCLGSFMRYFEDEDDCCSQDNGESGCECDKNYKDDLEYIDKNITPYYARPYYSTLSTRKNRVYAKLNR